VSCTSVGPVNMSCQSGWPCWVCHVVGSMIHPGHFILMCLLGVNIVWYHSSFHPMICVLRNGVLTCRHCLWPTLVKWYSCTYNPTSVSVSCTHGGVGYQCVGLRCTSIVSQRWVFPSLTFVVYSRNWDLLCFNLFLSMSLILLICGFL